VIDAILSNVDRKRLQDSANDIERLARSGDLAFGGCNKSALSDSTVLYLEHFVEKSGISYEVCVDEFGGVRLFAGSVLFKLDDSLVGYLQHDPVTDTHMWANHEFTEGIDGETVFLYMVSRQFTNGALKG
jgi:hypothetical protein